jgi:hypothetical protein
LFHCSVIKIRYRPACLPACLSAVSCGDSINLTPCSSFVNSFLNYFFNLFSTWFSTAAGHTHIPLGSFAAFVELRTEQTIRAAHVCRIFDASV